MPGFNPFRYRFPYTNINDINLDWIIKRVKTLSETVSHIDMSRIDEIAQQAETAQEDAETALTTAQSAETTANSVQGIANNALTTAQSAETTANSVQGIANNALSTAQSAETTAQSAETTANSVQSIANNALSTAQSAETTAQSAETTANSVQSIANNALSTAQSAETTAQSAETTATALDSSKADKVRNATNGNFAGLDANGNLTDSGHKNSDYAASDLNISGASVNEFVKITAVDANGRPTAYGSGQSGGSGSGDVTSDMLAIVQNTDTAAQNITKGQYVIWRGALYTALSAIAFGEALSSANLSAVSDGGLNDIKDSLIPYSVVVSGTTTSAGLLATDVPYDKIISTTIATTGQNWFCLVRRALNDTGAIFIFDNGFNGVSSRQVSVNVWRIP